MIFFKAIKNTMIRWLARQPSLPGLPKNKEYIIAWLDCQKVNNYELIQDEKYGFVVNVNGSVSLSYLKKIKVKFNYVNGNFNCGYSQKKQSVSRKTFRPIGSGSPYYGDNTNKIKSLEFCPEIVGGSFDCSNNKLSSLEYAPKIVKKSFNCSNNQLISLKYCPKEIGGNFDSSNNKLNSLKYCPKKTKHFFCNGNKLISLEHSPDIIEGVFSCRNNDIISLEYCPEFVSDKFFCDTNKNLKEFQSIIDFKIIYSKHKELLAENFAGKLNLEFKEKIKKTAVKL